MSIKKIIKNPIFIIVVTYLLAHCFMLVLSGCWWDDWSFMSHDLTYVNEVATGSGRPEWNLLIPLCWSLPNNGKFLIFILYLLDSIFVYNILKESTLFSKRNSLIITLLFTIIPVNDARILISNFPYSVGLFLFYLAFMLFIKWNKNSKKFIYRTGILLLFFFSFILNSLFAYYYILIAYLFVIDIKQNKEEKIIQKILTSIKNISSKYLDFFILPFVYIVVNKLLFPITNEAYAGRSSISIEGFIKCMKYLPLSIVNVIKEIFANLSLSTIYIPILILFIVCIVCLKQRINIINKPINKKYIEYFIYGLITLCLALFVYVEVRGHVIVTNGVQGRDSILIPLGIAIMIFSVLSMFNKKVESILSAIIVVLGIFSFNSLYIEWQKDYYYQLSMENLMNNEIIKENDTFFLADLNETKVEGQRYYSLNTNAYHVFNNQTRIFIPKVSNLYLLKDEKQIKNAKNSLNGAVGMMKEYNPDDYNLDAIIIFSCNLSTYDVFDLKIKELFDLKTFEDEIKNKGEMKIIEVDDNFTKELLDKYDNGLLKDDNDVINLLMNYN